MTERTFADLKDAFMVDLKDKERAAKERVCLALDVDSVDAALDLAVRLSGVVGHFKVGKSLHATAGNEGVAIVKELYFRNTSPSRDYNIFLDLKLHDTPDQVYRTARECSIPGVSMLNVHVAGGEKMCKEALRGVGEKQDCSYRSKAKVIGVTVLTSLDDSDLRKEGLSTTYDELVLRRTELAREWGLDGIVCPANKAGELEKRFGKWLYVTPGIKYAGVQNVGQKQLDTPDGAVAACKSSILVIGTAIRGTKQNPKTYAQMQDTAYQLLQVMATCL